MHVQSLRGKLIKNKLNSLFSGKIMGRIVIIILTALAVIFMSWLCNDEENDKESFRFSEIVSAEGKKPLSSSSLDLMQSKVTVIDLHDDGKSEISGDGAVAALSGISIDCGGTYVLKGKLSDGQIYVNAENGGELVLDGADIKSLKGAAIVATGGETRLVLQEGTENYLSDAKKYADGEFTDGCIYSEKSLVISGKGKLKIDGNYADGISCGEKLVIEGGELSVEAVRNALHGKGAVLLRGGNVYLGA